VIKIENVDIYGWEAAIRGMRNPMNSWDKSDSHYVDDKFVIGENDIKLMQSLSKAGKDHGKFLRYLTVQLDITAPFYWWKEFKTYRKGRKFMDDGDELLDPEEFEMFIETNSCSTMHKIHAKPFELDDFSHEHLTEGLLEAVLKPTIEVLNTSREAYLNYDELSKDDPDGWDKGITCKKDIWWHMIQLLPSSYNQKRTVQLNYQVLKSMYFARRHHKLDEWREFCAWCESLPYFKEICIQE
jgi:hypothetical protein